MDEDLIEKRIAGESVFDGKLLHVRRDTVLLPNGHETIREWVKHPGASAVLPVLDDGSVILVRQYRYPVGQAGRAGRRPVGMCETGIERGNGVRRRAL